MAARRGGGDNPMAQQELKEAVWGLLQEYARKDPAMTIHSDIVIRKFPKVNEQELINAIGELILDGRISAKSATVDAYGNATAFHMRVRGGGDHPTEASKPPRSGISDFSVGFGDTKAATSQRETEELKPPKKVGMHIKDDKIGVGFGVDDQPPAPPRAVLPEERPERVNVSLGGKKEAYAAWQEEAEQHFADEVASFFAELDMAEASDPAAKKHLTDQMMVLIAMFQSEETVAFATPISKLAALKTRVEQVAPELANDYILLIQTAVRAWLGRV
jgi:hypothetical protein